MRVMEDLLLPNLSSVVFWLKNLNNYDYIGNLYFYSNPLFSISILYENKKRCF